MNKNINWISISRTFGIVLVVLGHAITGADAENDIFGKIILTIISSFHMPLFFIISGYLFYKHINEVQLKSFIKNKIFDLLVPYTLMSTVYCLLGRITNDDIYTLKALTKCLYRPISHFWFLYVLFFVSLFSFAFLKLLQIDLNKIFVINIILLVTINAFKINLWQYDFPIYKIIYYNLFFFVGCLLNKHKYNGKIDSKFLIITFIIYIFGVLIIYFEKNNIFVDISCAVSGSLILFNLSNRLNAKFLIYIGNNTMPIYLVHSLFLSFSRKLLSQVITENMLIAILTSLVGLIFPLGLCRIASKNRIYNILFYPRKILLHDKLEVDNE